MLQVDRRQVQPVPIPELTNTGSHSVLHAVRKQPDDQDQYDQDPVESYEIRFEGEDH